METKEVREFRAEVVVPYELAVGRTWSKFYDALKEEKILGTRCNGCERVFVPPRTFCPRCFEEMDECIAFLETLGMSGEEKAQLYHVNAARLGF